MLRFTTFSKLNPSVIILVAGSGRQVCLSRLPLNAARSLSRTLIGFYFRFRGKSIPVGDPSQAAYFLRICDIAPSFASFAPHSIVRPWLPHTPPPHSIPPHSAGTAPVPFFQDIAGYNPKVGAENDGALPVALRLKDRGPLNTDQAGA